MTINKYNISIFIFRRDLRLNDNTGLIHALAESKYVIPLFIFTPTQVSNENKYKSSNAIQFMIESLYDLNHQIRKINHSCKLWTAYGDELVIIKKILNKLKVDNVGAIYLNEDYSPYSIKRDDGIKKFCIDNNIDCNSYTDVLLTDNHDIHANNGNRYHNFTLFYKKALTFKIRKPNLKISNNFKPLIPEFKSWKISVIDKFLLKKQFYQNNGYLAVRGGRTNAQEILRGIRYLKNYKINRNYPAFTTTMLSAHNKFGTVSIREVYHAFLKEKTGELVKNLYWRDFYYYISIYFKKMYKHEHLLKSISKKKIINWGNNKIFFTLWKQGKTGFPLVDAAMNEINTTGFMHNRSRLVVSHFLIKDLLIDWKYGERYFSKKLVDIDRAQNTGNWNWSASYGLDGTPFLRIFNPWSQSKKYDPDCIYIKKWLPQLKDIEPKHIHHWYKYYKSYSDTKYPKPIIDHSVQRKKFIYFYKNYFKK